MNEVFCYNNLQSSRIDRMKSYLSSASTNENMAAAAFLRSRGNPLLRIRLFPDELGLSTESMTSVFDSTYDADQ